MRLLIPLAALAIAACQPAAEEAVAAPATTPAAAPAPAAARVSDFSQDMTALGTEPFWNLKIQGVTFTLTRPDQPDLVATAPGAAIGPGRASWAAVTPAGEALNVALTITPCSDGMSDRSYPMTAEVEVAGQTLRGCAVKSAEMPKG